MSQSKLIADLSFTVFKKLGYGMPVAAYQNGYSIVLAEHGYHHTRNDKADVFFDQTKVATLTAHFIVEGNLLLEVTNKKEISDLELVKTKRKLFAFGLQEAIHINFDARQVQYKRIQL